MKIINSLGKYAINKAKKSKYMQSLFEAPLDMNSFPVFGTFTDSFGQEHKLHKGLRSKMKPGWEAMLTKQKTDLSEKGLQAMINNGKIAADRLLPLLSSCGLGLQGLRMLEIGCHSGATSFAIAALGAEHITASEFTGYKVESVDEKGVSTEKLQEVDQELRELRALLAKRSANSARVEFREDNICDTKMEKNSYDLICSWDVLEHLEDYASALSGMASLLKKGGLIIHEYNPFFALNGGHSPCTLDLPWGHVRIPEQDFQRYVEQFRPQESEMACSFFRKGLNRMTQDQLVKAVSDSGFELLALIPYHKEYQVRMLNHDILSQCIRNYPALKLSDLTAPKVIVIGRKVGE